MTTKYSKTIRLVTGAMALLCLLVLIFTVGYRVGVYHCELGRAQTNWINVAPMCVRALEVLRAYRAGETVEKKKERAAFLDLECTLSRVLSNYNFYLQKTNMLTALLLPCTEDELAQCVKMYMSAIVNYRRHVQFEAGFYADHMQVLDRYAYLFPQGVEEEGIRGRVYANLRDPIGTTRP